MRNKPMATLVLTRTFQSCFNSDVKMYGNTQKLLTKADADFLKARSTFNDRLLIQTNYRDSDVHALVKEYVKSTETLINELSNHYRTDDKDYLNAIEKFSDTLKQHGKWLANVYHNTDKANNFTSSINSYIEKSKDFEQHSKYCVENYSPPKLNPIEQKIEQNPIVERKIDSDKDYDSPSPF